MISPKPDSVVLTVYRDQPRTAQQLREAEPGDTGGLAMVTETRTVDLPTGVSRIVFQGVADEIIPASARLDGLPGRIVERNFDYNLTTPGSLIEKSVGGQVTVRRLDVKTGRVTEEPATLTSGPDGVVVVTKDGVEALGCGSGPEALVFDHLPVGLADRPTLSVLADAPHAGRYVLQLSYLMVRVDWSADYVARIAPDGKTLDLTGWLTLSNRSGATFGGAPTSVVAGRLARVDPDLPDITPVQRADECWPMGTTSDWRPRPPLPPAAQPEGSVSELVVTAEVRRENIEKIPVSISAFTSRATESSLGDYKLYNLVEPTTLAARETKQIRFLEQSGVRFQTLYVMSVDVDAYGQDDTEPSPATVTLSFENKAAKGLGRSLPAGSVSVRQPLPSQDGREFFFGASSIRDVPVGEPFELPLGRTSDVETTVRQVSDATLGAGDNARERSAGEITVTNAKPSPITFEFRLPSGERGLKVARESLRHALRNGSLVWRLTVPANGSAKLDLTLDTDA